MTLSWGTWKKIAGGQEDHERSHTGERVPPFSGGRSDTFWLLFWKSVSSVKGGFKRWSGGREVG